MGGEQGGKRRIMFVVRCHVAPYCAVGVLCCWVVCEGGKARAVRGRGHCSCRRRREEKAGREGGEKEQRPQGGGHGLGRAVGGKKERGNVRGKSREGKGGKAGREGKNYL